MKITKVVAKNFQSYAELEFDFSNLGLALISGPTGAGKSSLMDAVSWCLFGVTSKDGAADDVLTWGGENLTAAMVRLETPSGGIAVYRMRGAKSDLHWSDVDEQDNVVATHRGKDARETQKLLEEKLGVTAELFLMSAYMTQFSRADSFFIASAKDRREVLEQIADQEFAIHLGERASEGQREVRTKIFDLERKVASLTGKIEGIENTIKYSEANAERWETDQKIKVKAAEASAAKFETTKQASLKEIEAEVYKLVQELETLPEDLPPAPKAIKKDKFCPECKQKLPRPGEVKVDDSTVYRKKYLKDRLEDHKRRYNELNKQTNHWGREAEQLRSQKNPYHTDKAKLQSDLVVLTSDLDQLNANLRVANTTRDALEWIYAKSFELRGLMMARVVQQVNDQTNEYLERFFDAAIRVTFSLEGSDKLQIAICNNGHEASFRQLSGGERCMLKLAFSLSIMKAAQNKAGVKFDMIMLDEPLNGLDESLKAKAFGLLQQLETEYSTVLCIEHSAEIKQHFLRTFCVEKNDGKSEIYESTNNA